MDGTHWAQLLEHQCDLWTVAIGFQAQQMPPGRGGASLRKLCLAGFWWAHREGDHVINSVIWTQVNKQTVELHDCVQEKRRALGHDAFNPLAKKSKHFTLLELFWFFPCPVIWINKIVLFTFSSYSNLVGCYWLRREPVCVQIMHIFLWKKCKDSLNKSSEDWIL